MTTNFIKVGQTDTGGVLIEERIDMMTVVKELKIDHLKKKCTLGFIIIIGRDDGKFELHERLYNPCQGGHLRRYGLTHSNCTRPHDDLPGDLHNPFPNGKPVGLIYRLDYLNSPYSKACFSNASPWISGFGGEDNIIIDGGYLYIKSGDFDPTVFVNLLKATNHSTASYNRCLEAGLNQTEALTFNMFFINPYGATSYVLKQSTYTFDPMNSIRRMVEQRPVNITGGTFDDKGKLIELGSGLWGDGFDYNRPDMACIFRPSKSLDEKERDEKVFPLAKEFVKIKSGRQGITFEECLELFNQARVY